LSRAGGAPIIVAMAIHSDDPAHGFQFPGTFELSAMGAADQHLEAVLPQHLLEAGIEVLHESVNWRHSSNGKYVSVRISFRARSREEYERAHQALRDHPEVKWTL
jgi:putative lipoic acid-binding regulatory protein